MSNFTALPQELRDEIWKQTLEPRVITISVHLLNTKDPLGPNEDGVCFTASLGYPNDLFKRTPVKKTWASIAVVGKLSQPCIPVAAYVCRESRRVFLARYEAAFVCRREIYGTPYSSKAYELWNKYHLGDNRIWIDFKRDIIVLNQADQLIKAGRGFRGLGVLRTYASEEVRKIRRLAITGGWATIEPSGEPWKHPSIRPECSLYREMMFQMDRFDNLEELIIVHVDRRRREEWPADWRDVDLNRVEEEIKEFLETENGRDQTWPNKMPCINVIKNLDDLPDRQGEIFDQSQFIPPTATSENDNFVT
ncbi:hypothetical protein B0O99DRAFT_641700 [Bisporella sp. PMI_857]|nr:hypothetical protein B0O99DRAFT_641700 [Bisporella sp. PMI_857]